MKTLGKIFLFLVFAAVVSLVYYWQVLSQPIPQIPSKTLSTTAVYNNDEYQFSVVYDKKYNLSTENNQESYFTSGGSTLASISIPQSLYPKTNFAIASIIFSGKDKSTNTDCQTYTASTGKNKKMTKTATVNSLVFFTDDFSGAAAGTKYDTKLYRILHLGKCYELNLKVGLSNIGNYEPSAVTEVTLEEILPKLQRIAETFKFTDEPKVAEGPGILSGHMTAPTREAYDLTQIVVYSADRSQIITRADLDANGNYYLELPAGTYYATYTSVYNTFQPPMKKIIIISGESAKVDFSIN